MKKLLLLFVLFTLSCESEPTDVDVLISGGVIHDGTGMSGYTVSYTHLRAHET